MSLRAMELPEERMGGSLRFRFGRFNPEAEVRAIAVVSKTISKLRKFNAGPLTVRA